MKYLFLFIIVLLSSCNRQLDSKKLFIKNVELIEDIALLAGNVANNKISKDDAFLLIDDFKRRSEELKLESEKIGFDDLPPEQKAALAKPFITRLEEAKANLTKALSSQSFPSQIKDALLKM